MSSIGFLLDISHLIDFAGEDQVLVGIPLEFNLLKFGLLALLMSVIDRYSLAGLALLKSLKNFLRVLWSGWLLLFFGALCGLLYLVLLKFLEVQISARLNSFNGRHQLAGPRCNGIGPNSVLLIG